jgi:3-deoxy-D-manno-octulosonic-acid transferase
MARSLWPEGSVIPTPLDFTLSAKRFIKQVNPDFLILIETDIWPRILKELNRKDIRASLVSARLSPRSFRNYKLIKGFWKKVLGSFETIAVQSEEDLSKFLCLGVDPAKMMVTGNLKFDENPLFNEDGLREELLKQTGWPEGNYVIAGSTHPGEDALILMIFQGLMEAHPDLKLVIAPRDKPKFEAVWHRIKASFPNECARRSMPSETDKNAKVFLLDTLGELSKFYALSDLAIIGKSFPGRHEGGGHNPLEASLLGNAVISGPLNHNFKSMYKALVKAKGAVVVDTDDLPTILASLLNDPQKIKEMGESGKNFVYSHRGSVQKTLEFINPPSPKEL